MVGLVWLWPNQLMQPEITILYIHSTIWHKGWKTQFKLDNMNFSFDNFGDCHSSLESFGGFACMMLGLYVFLGVHPLCVLMPVGMCVHGIVCRSLCMLFIPFIFVLLWSGNVHRPVCSCICISKMFLHWPHKSMLYDNLTSISCIPCHCCIQQYQTWLGFWSPPAGLDNEDIQME